MSSKSKRPKKRKPKQPREREAERDGPVSLHPMQFTDAVAALFQPVRRPAGK